MTEKLQDMENEAMSKIVELEKQLMQRNKDLESIRVRFPLRAFTSNLYRKLLLGFGASPFFTCLPLTQEVYKDTSTQVHSLRQMLKEKDEAIQRQSNLEKKIHELEKQGTIKIHKKGDGDISILASSGGEGFTGAGMAGNGTAVGPNHMGVPTPPPPPPPPPPMPLNGSCRLNINQYIT